MDHKEDPDSRDPLCDIEKTIQSRSQHHYSKEQLLDIKEHPHSRQRPSCLLDKYDSDGVWDPEKWHASLYPTSGRSSPVEGLRKEPDTDRASLKRRIDPRERVKEDDLDVVLSPQRRSFGGGCHVTTAVNSRQAGSPLDNKENESLRLMGGRRIGSGRIMAARAFERDPRGGEKDLRDPREGRDRERDYKDKRFRREYGDSKRVFGERRRNDSYTEEEPEWFSAGPTSQSETIELTGFDDKILEEDQKGRKRTRKRMPSLKGGFECNGAMLEEEPVLPPEPSTDQEVPREAVLPEPAPGEFDFNEFFNLDKSVPGLALRNLDSHLLASSDVSGPALQRNILQDLLGPPMHGPATSNVLSNLMGALDPATSLLRKRTPSPQMPQVFPTRAASADYLRAPIPSPIGFASGHQHLHGEPFLPGMLKSDSPMMSQVSALDIHQAALEGLIPHELANYYQAGYGKLHMDTGRDGFRSRQQQRMKSPVSNLRGASMSPGPGATVTSMLSPSFTPTSVIRKMYESKEKSKDEMSVGKPSVRGKEEGQRAQEDGALTGPGSEDTAPDASLETGTKFPTSRRSACTPPLSHQSRYAKDQDYRPKSSGRRTPTVASPVPGATFLRPLHQVPIVPIVRPTHQLHPGLVQRILAQGVPPQHLPLLQAGLLPPGVDLSALQGLAPSALGQPFYPLAAAGHPLLNQRSANPLQLAMMQQSSGSGAQGFPGLHLPPQGMTRHGLHMMDQRPAQRSTSPVGLAKWFGSDVLQQPLPSMPAKVISVDELEYRQ
ncbi:hypothetical protein FKM82_005113 [Ascaphus truei]